MIINTDMLNKINFFLPYLSDNGPKKGVIDAPKYKKT